MGAMPAGHKGGLRFVYVNLSARGFCRLSLALIGLLLDSVNFPPSPPYPCPLPRTPTTDGARLLCLA